MEISLILCIVVVVALLICISIFVRMLKNLRNDYDTLIESYQNLEILNQTLRAQRHDYMNHLQVVISMIELEEYDNLKSYLDPVYQDIQKTGKALKTSKPAVNALLAVKANETKTKGIDMYLQIKSNLKELCIPDWELCKVLSNIIDNAATALETCQGKKKEIIVDVTENQNRYIFEISNNGPEIPKEMQMKIFQYGVTSKKEEGHGVGLSIVDKVVKDYHGEIKLSSNEDETKFIIAFDKKAGGENK